MARTFHVIVPWTYDNIGSQMADSSVMLNVPYEWFAHTLGATDSANESLSLSDSFGDMAISSDAHETLTMKGQFTAKPNLPAYEPMFISDKLGNTSANVVAVESMTIGETSNGDAEITDHRFLSVYDTYAKADNGETTEETNAEREPVTILSDVEISYQPEYDDEFKSYTERKSPLGYSSIRPLYPGDYEYQDAIVGIQVDLTPPVSGRFGVAGATLHIDVEDVVDKGQEIFDENRPYSGRTRVWFSKKFYTRPNVFTEVRNANPPCRVNILAVDTRGIGSDSSHQYGYFDFELLNFTDGTAWQSGDVTVAWNAVGY